MVLTTYSLSGAGLHTTSAFSLLVHFSKDGILSVCRSLLSWLDLLEVFLAGRMSRNVVLYRFAVEACIIPHSETTVTLTSWRPHAVWRQLLQLRHKRSTGVINSDVTASWHDSDVFVLLLLILDALTS